MSQHADLTKWNVVQSIKQDLNAEQAIESYAGMLAAAEYDDNEANPKYIISTAEYMLTQIDGVYGVSHTQITNWLIREIAGLIIGKVLFERDNSLDSQPKK